MTLLKRMDSMLNFIMLRLTIRSKNGFGKLNLVGIKLNIWNIKKRAWALFF